MSSIPDRVSHQPTTLLDLAHRPHGSLLVQEFFVVAIALQSQDLLGLMGSDFGFVGLDFGLVGFWFGWILVGSDFGLVGLDVDIALV
jgi:hypothetical protein